MVMLKVEYLFLKLLWKNREHTIIRYSIHNDFQWSVHDGGVTSSQLSAKLTLSSKYS